MEKSNEIYELSGEQVKNITGGSVAENRRIAEDVCGKENVKSVTATGFECFKA